MERQSLDRGTSFKAPNVAWGFRQMRCSPTVSIVQSALVICQERHRDGLTSSAMMQAQDPKIKISPHLPSPLTVAVAAGLGELVGGLSISGQAQEGPKGARRLPLAAAPTNRTLSIAVMQLPDTVSGTLTRRANIISLSLETWKLIA